MFRPVSLVFLALLTVACSTTRAPLPARDASQGVSKAPAVSIVNRLSWFNPVDGKRDGLRTAWPLHQLVAVHAEHFPLAQVRQCDRANACRWGVVRATRTISQALAHAQGVTLQLDATVQVARRQQAFIGGEQTAMAIPADVDALESTHSVRQPVTLAYGVVTRIGFGHGIAYDLCAQRLNASGQALDECPVAFH